MFGLGGSIKSDWSTAGVVITLRMKVDSGAVYERPNAGRAEGSKSLFLRVLTRANGTNDMASR